MKHLYHFGILCYGMAIKLAALFGNSKAKKWIKGREKWKNKINEFDNRILLFGFTYLRLENT